MVTPDGPMKRVTRPARIEIKATSRPTDSDSCLATAMRAFDFFSGCGGTSAGLRRSGVKVIGGLDLDRHAGRTFRLNFPEACFLERDIRNVKAEDLDDLIGVSRAFPLLFAACAPCQPFSKQNRHRHDGDDRRSLLDELRRFVHRFEPEYLFLENVPGLQKGCDRDSPLTEFLRFLDCHGYACSFDTVQMVRFGIPQYRMRLVMVASRLSAISLPKPTHGPGTCNTDYPSVWDVIGGYPALKAGERHRTIPNHVASGLSPLNLARIRATPEGGTRESWPDELVLGCHRGYSGHSDVYGRLHRDRPASALTTRCISLSNGRFGHPVQDRALSVREAAALQSFDDSFVFEGSLNAMAQQIGNAVPTRLAEVFGRHFQEHWCKHGKAH